MTEKKVASRQERLLFEKMIQHDMANPVPRNMPTTFPTPQNHQNYVPITPNNNLQDYPIQNSRAIQSETPITKAPVQRLIPIKRNIGKRDIIWEEKRRMKMQLVENIMRGAGNNNGYLSAQEGVINRRQDQLYEPQPDHRVQQIAPSQPREIYEREQVAPYNNNPINQRLTPLNQTNPQRTPMGQIGQQKTSINPQRLPIEQMNQQRTPIGQINPQRTPIGQEYPQRTPIDQINHQNIPINQTSGYTPQQRTPLYNDRDQYANPKYYNNRLQRTPMNNNPTPQYPNQQMQSSPNYVPNQNYTPQRNIISPANQTPLRSPYQNYPPQNGYRNPTSSNPIQSPQYGDPNMYQQQPTRSPNQQIRTPYQQMPSRTPQMQINRTMGQTPYNPNSVMRNSRTPFADYKPAGYGVNRMENANNFQISNRPPSRPFGNVSFKGNNSSRGNNIDPYYYERENINTNNNYMNTMSRQQQYY